MDHALTLEDAVVIVTGQAVPSFRHSEHWYIPEGAVAWSDQTGICWVYEDRTDTGPDQVLVMQQMIPKPCCKAGA